MRTTALSNRLLVPAIGRTPRPTQPLTTKRLYRVPTTKEPPDAAEILDDRLATIRRDYEAQLELVDVNDEYTLLSTGPAPAGTHVRVVAISAEGEWYFVFAWTWRLYATRTKPTVFGDLSDDQITYPYARDENGAFPWCTRVGYYSELSTYPADRRVGCPAWFTLVLRWKYTPNYFYGTLRMTLDVPSLAYAD